MVCPAAFDDASAAALLELVPEPLVLTEEEALTTFCRQLDRASAAPS